MKECSSVYWAIQGSPNHDEIQVYPQGDASCLVPLPTEVGQTSFLPGTAVVVVVSAAVGVVSAAAAAVAAAAAANVVDCSCRVVGGGCCLGCLGYLG